MESSLIIQGTQGHLIVRYIVNWMDILLPQNYLKREIIIVIFDSRIVRRTVCESMPSRVQKLLQWVVAFENQHAIRAVRNCKGTPTITY